MTSETILETTDAHGDVWLSDVQLAQRWGVNRATVWRWLQTKHDFPKPVALSERVRRWRSSEIAVWERARERVEVCHAAE